MREKGKNQENNVLCLILVWWNDKSFCVSHE